MNAENLKLKDKQDFLDLNETDDEISIYKTQSSGQNLDIPQNDLKLSYNFSASEKKLCFIGNDTEFIPPEIIYEFGLKTLILDISFNNMSDLVDLEQFPYLEELICDNNNISDKSQFPKLKNLKILSCNKNNIDDIHVFIDKVKSLFPNLNYLSLLGNRACPNQLIDENKDEYDYSRYRKYVIYRLKNLKFLDTYQVTQDERDIVERDALFFETVKGENQFEEQSSDNQVKKISNYTPLPENRDNDAPKSSFGFTRYVYYGKQSEGNRFIRNDDL